MFRVSVIHSKGTRRITVYMVKPRGVHEVVFILLNKSFYGMALNLRGRRMSEKIKMASVLYLLMHLSEEGIPQLLV